MYGLTLRDAIHFSLFRPFLLAKTFPIDIIEALSSSFLPRYIFNKFFGHFLCANNLTKNKFQPLQLHANAYNLLLSHPLVQVKSIFHKSSRLIAQRALTQKKNTNSGVVQTDRLLRRIFFIHSKAKLQIGHQQKKYK